jgi:hypothetical protein
MDVVPRLELGEAARQRLEVTAGDGRGRLVAAASTRARQSTGLEPASA